jgi:hypothetical protein
MAINTEDLTRFAQWEPVATGFDRDELTIHEHIQPILDRIGVSQDVPGSHLQKVAYSIFEDGGLTNYFAFFVFYSRDEGRAVGAYRYQAGISLYLSLLAPVGVCGHAERMLGRDVSGPPYLEIEDLVDPHEPQDSLAALVVAAVHASDYRLLSPQEARQPLPEGIQPYEYCMCREPWDRVFHVLFANTD